MISIVHVKEKNPHRVHLETRKPNAEKGANRERKQKKGDPRNQILYTLGDRYPSASRSLKAASQSKYVQFALHTREAELAPETAHEMEHVDKQGSFQTDSGCCLTAPNPLSREEFGTGYQHWKVVAHHHLHPQQAVYHRASARRPFPSRQT